MGGGADSRLVVDVVLARGCHPGAAVPVLFMQTEGGPHGGLSGDELGAAEALATQQ